MKSLWLHKNKPELKTKRISEGKILKESGNPVLDLFFKKYSGGSECGRNQIEEEKDWPLAIDLTKQAIKDGVKILYNPAFFANDLLVDIHLLQKNDDGSYTAFVLKIATRISDRSLQAAAYQLFAIENSGIIISEFKFVIINNHYRLRGELDRKSVV